MTPTDQVFSDNIEEPAPVLADAAVSPLGETPPPVNIDELEQALDTGVPSDAMPKLTGLQKAAIMLVTLGEERASKILSHLDPEEAEPLIIKVAQTQNVPPDYVHLVMSEVVETAIARGYFYGGGIEYARGLLRASFGEEKAEALLARLQTVIEPTPFRFLNRTPPEQIYSFMRREHNQIVALVLAHLPDSHSAAVLQMFDSQRKGELLYRIATMGQINPHMLSQVESTIRSKMHTLLGSQTARVGGIEAAAGLINRVDRQTEREVFDALTERDPEMADQLRQLLFVFEDLVKLDQRAIRAIVQRSDQADLALALRSQSEEVRDIFYANMSDRASEALREEIEISPPRPRKEIEEAQQKIVQTARRLEEQGEISIFRGSDEEEVI